MTAALRLVEGEKITLARLDPVTSQLMGDDPGGAEPTELAGATEAETESVHAWALSDEDVELPTRRIATPGRLTAAAVIASAAVCAIAATVVYYNIHASQPRAALAATVPPAPNPMLLNGTYSVFHDWGQTTYRDNERKDGGTNHWTNNGAPAVSWWIFTSACTPSLDCIATGNRLDDNDHQKIAAGSQPDMLRLLNGFWTDVTPSTFLNPCTASDGTVLGRARTSVRWSLQPSPDGALLRGNETYSVETGECGDQGDTSVTPVTATRVVEAMQGI